MLKRFPLPKPRAQQVGCLERIHQALIVEDRRVFVLDAPTGVGKSAIGVAAASYCGSAFITSPQNALVEQYQGDYTQLHAVIGKANYECRNFPFPRFKQAEFMAKQLRDCQTAEDSDEDRHKDVCCDYRPAMRDFWRGSLSVTNVDFLFWAQCPENLEGGRPHRRLLVIDECHGLEKKLIELGTFEVTQTHCTVVGFDMRRFPRLPNQQSKVETALREYQDRVAATQFKTKKQARTYRRESEKIDVALNSGDWFYWTGAKGEFVICPMKAHVAAAQLFNHADKILFMSATVGNAEQFLGDLGIAEKDAACLYVDSPFAPENRMLSYYPIASVSQKTYATTLPHMQEACREVLRNYHPKEKGLVLCTSYPKQLDLARGLAEFGSRILIHTADNREEVIARHCKSSEPTVLLGVAMAEGLDLFDERARFLVWPKVPFMSLGDPYVKERKRRDERWYARQTAVAITQGCGRVVRSDIDHAAIYMLDAQWGSFVDRNEALFPPWFLDAVEHGPTKTRRPHRVPRRTTVKMMLREGTRPTRSRKWVTWVGTDGRMRLSPPGRAGGVP